jgi:Flp pilus assembly protein TadB
MSGSVTAMLIGAGAGFGLFLILRSFRRSPISLLDQIASLRRVGRPVTADLEPGTGLGWDEVRRRLGIFGARLLAAAGLLNPTTVGDQLRALDKPIERHAYEKLLAGAVLAVLPSAMAVVLGAGGHPVDPVYGLVGGVVAGAAGFFYPDWALAGQVTARRRGFRHALSSYLDLVTIALAGGAGIESALRGAAEAGDGWAFAEIRAALRRAELTGITPWQSFEQLGASLGVGELRELAASVSLAGELGAKVRQSLVAKADAMRAQQAAEIETAAESNTERMIGPAVMVLGLTLFLFYGALGAINPNRATPEPDPPPPFSTLSTTRR